MRSISSLLLIATLAIAQQRPNLDAQKTAMRKLEFLAGKWVGSASAQIGPGKTVNLTQTEQIEYRLDGMLLTIEGTGRDPETSKVLFNAFAVVSYDESAGEYAIRAYSDGRKIDSKLETDGKGFAWTMSVANGMQVRHAMRLTDKGNWSETSTVKLPSGQEFTQVRMDLEKK
jgi:hypothetical protein